MQSEITSLGISYSEVGAKTLWLSVYTFESQDGVTMEGMVNRRHQGISKSEHRPSRYHCLVTHSIGPPPYLHHLLQHLKGQVAHCQNVYKAQRVPSMRLTVQSNTM